MKPTKNTYGLIEAGGTKIVCAIAKSPTDISDLIEIPTRSANETLDDIITYFQDMIQKHGSLDAIGLGAFGPIDVHWTSRSYGRIGRTTKPGWSDLNIRVALVDALRVPVYLDTDVNSALLGEATYGAGKGLKNLAYVTVGTGIGAGILIDGDVLHCGAHTEIGHMITPRFSDDNIKDGVCSFHKDRCYEGLASGPALYTRWGVKGDELHASHPAWDLQARYLANLCLDLTMATAPDRIIFGGGVMKQSHLYPLIRQHFLRLNNDYLDIRGREGGIDNYIVPAGLGTNAGIMGAYILALRGAKTDT